MFFNHFIPDKVVKPLRRGEVPGLKEAEVINDNDWRDI